MSKRHDARVGTHNIELAKMSDGLCEQGDDIFNDGDVGFDGDGVATGSSYGGHDLICRFGTVCVIDSDLSTTTPELESHFAANTSSFILKSA
jgi:hypothetical protein